MRWIVRLCVGLSLLALYAGAALAAFDYAAHSAYGRPVVHMVTSPREDRYVVAP